MSRQAATVRTPRAKPNHIESQHQRALMQWCQLNLKKYPELEMLVAIPNGGARSKIEAGIMKAEGVRAGVHDLFLFVSRGGYHGLSIEMKKPGGKPTQDQLLWKALLEARNYAAAICDDWEQAREVLVRYAMTGRIE